jgi:hypothetical protein
LNIGDKRNNFATLYLLQDLCTVELGARRRIVKACLVVDSDIIPEDLGARTIKLRQDAKVQTWIDDSIKQQLCGPPLIRSVH